MSVNQEDQDAAISVALVVALLALLLSILALMK